MTFHIITIFPHIFDSYFNESILARAQKRGLIRIKIYNLRDWAQDRHKTVDDKPFGGGAGMVMKADVIYKAIENINFQIKNQNVKSNPNSKFRILKSNIINHKSKIILFSAKGKTWNQTIARKYSRLDNIIMICGRYEGVDERVKKFVDEEISIGDFVLTGGEIPAMVIVDSITRLRPQVLGNAASPRDESHSIAGCLEYPQYTRPETLDIEGKKYRVPKILLSGNHQTIAEWRKKNIKK